jgi:hypothetical protein
MNKNSLTLTMKDYIEFYQHGMCTIISNGKVIGFEKEV